MFYLSVHTCAGSSIVFQTGKLSIPIKGKLNSEYIYCNKGGRGLDGGRGDHVLACSDYFTETVFILVRVLVRATLL